ncbi:transposase [Gemmatimonas sp.]|uniref:IS110 family transposase n=1 Tax=Gemmatimonas sp. TaxID=1962908 RepID=UPI003564F435
MTSSESGMTGQLVVKRWLVLRGIVETRIAPSLSTRSPSTDGAHTVRPVTVAIIGLDVQKRESQLSIKADDGSITDRRIATSRERFTAVFGELPQARIVLEASTESECVARHLESLGHEVIVADPNYAPMYANRSRHTKTDKRDTRTLMDACETGA